MSSNNGTVAVCYLTIYIYNLDVQKSNDILSYVKPSSSKLTDSPTSRHFWVDDVPFPQVGYVFFPWMVYI